jgi:uncharacterized protein (TIGR02646 family)
MRRRRRPECPAVLHPDDSLGATERQTAIDHYEATDWEPEKKSFEFKVYRDASVRAALNAAFGNKCAYCESRIDTTQPTAVEHYRPKGAVDTEEERKRKPGYYWLAATWPNLLPSCTRCNSVENVEDASGVRHKSGKGNWFPLANEAMRVIPRGDVSGEKPQLLHPYEDDPDEHLAFDDDGVARGLTERGWRTIELLGLNRRGLHEQRRDKLRVVEAHLQKIEEYEADMARYPGEPSFRARRDREVEQLEVLLDRRQEYTAVVAHRLGLNRP